MYLNIYFNKESLWNADCYKMKVINVKRGGQYRHRLDNNIDQTTLEVCLYPKQTFKSK